MPTIHPDLAAASWPAPADPQAATRGMEGLAAELSAAGEEADALGRAMRSPEGEAALAALFGNSPFLTNCVHRDPAFAARLLREGPDAALEAVFAAMSRDAAARTTGDDLSRSLRIARRRAALAIAVADIAGLWPLAHVTAALSGFADRAIGLAVADQLRALAASGAIALADEEAPERGSGLVVLGMGKLGGRELNYSSDVDLIVLYDLERVRAADPDTLQKSFVRLVRGVVKLLEERTGDGYVLRTDLRLRPDPGATPLAMSTDAAEFYYETLGQNWERAAMIKARPVAGDIEAGESFLARLRPFLWRRHLDFAAVQDIHSIKRQIHAHRGGEEVTLAGHNIKVGRGGIREIEFFAQTLQLIWGGRDPTLRIRATCAALAALAGVGRADPAAVADLERCYDVLRRLEHRLQMIADQQTQTLPSDEQGIAHLATFMGHRDAEEFAERTLATLRTVERHYARLFEEAPELGGGGGGNLVFTGAEDDPGTLQTLAGLGFTDPPAVARQVRAWHHGRYRCMRSSRARELLTELMPALLGALGATPDPQAAFINFDRFMSRLPAGVQLFSLFHANPQLLGFVAEIMGGAPRLADQLSTRAGLLDLVIAESFKREPPGREACGVELAAALSQARDFQDTLDIVRRWRAERAFQVGVQLLRGALGAGRAGEALADIADATLVALKPAVEAEFRRQHGEVAGGEFAIVALGKLGSREMTATSDLDLVLLYDAPEGAASDGEKQLPAPQYFLRLATRFVNAVTAMTPEGSLYEIDTRLRPSGTKGPIATSLAGFRLYNLEDAWTWEHMALTRSRVVSASDGLRARIEATIAEVLRRARDPARTLADVAEMRLRMARERGQAARWDVKNRRGGIIDVEFAVQALLLLHGARAPGVLVASTRRALDALDAAGHVDGSDAQALRRSFDLCSAVQAVLRTAIDGAFDPAALPPALLAGLARAAGAPSFDALGAALDEACAAAMSAFERIVAPGAAAG